METQVLGGQPQAAPGQALHAMQALDPTASPAAEPLARGIGDLGTTRRRWLLALGDGLVVGLVAAMPANLGSPGGWPGFAPSVALATVAALYSAEQYSLKAHDRTAIAKCAIAGMAMAVLVALAAGLGLPSLAAIPVMTGLIGLCLIGARDLWVQFLRGRRRAKLVYFNGSAADRAIAIAEMRRHRLAGLRLLSPERRALAPFSVGAVELPSLCEKLSRTLPARHLDEAWFAEQFSWRRGAAYRAVKRMLDVTFALVGLGLFALFLPAIALAIRLEDRGPIFYSQTRVGLGGNEFRIYKIRTMRQDAERTGAVQAQVGDSRVTRTGRILRRTRLDEVPQLLNVLRAEMSIVGPRPERPDFVAAYTEAIPSYDRRHLVLPGITGWAQVRYPYGASLEDAEEKLKFDLYYVKHRSIAFDLLIMLRTVAVVLNRTGSR